MQFDQLSSMTKEEIPRLAKNLRHTDVEFLVKNLAEKDDTIRYNAFLLLQAASRWSPLVYKYWDELEEKLESPNSYQRNIGLRLISENVRWDKEGKFEETLDRYLLHCTDEKFVTSRQAVQGLVTVTQSTDRYDKRIQSALDGLSLGRYNAGQQRLLRKDLSDVRRVISSR